MNTVAPQSAAATRRCWRCLQQFPCPEAEIHAGPADWWLCDSCQESLIAPAQT
ncbi:MAG: hypothetical protein Q8M22_01830 [Actinomycetota bacterium]|nr:hypothetical protein [Actinomycetota bacterium]